MRPRGRTTEDIRSGRAEDLEFDLTAIFRGYLAKKLGGAVEPLATSSDLCLQPAFTRRKFPRTSCWGTKCYNCEDIQ